MHISFIYEKEKDVWCLLNKGKSSNNSQNPTRQYERLMAEYGDSPTEADVLDFVEKYISKNNIDVLGRAQDFQKEWESISSEFQKRAEAIFGITLPHDIVAYLTINSRCPYDIENNYFFVSLQSFDGRKTCMHELWHFYTWYAFGFEQEEKLGKQKYNDLKEALTVLLNVECKDLLPEGTLDGGYPQHQEIREKILEYWGKDRNIRNLWEYLITQ